MNVKVLKLVTGEDIIADVKESVGDWVLKNPFLLIINPVQNSIILVEYPLLPVKKKKELPIHSKHILQEWEPDSNVEDEYIQQSTGIALATNNPEEEAKKIIL